MRILKRLNKVQIVLLAAICCLLLLSVSIWAMPGLWRGLPEPEIKADFMHYTSIEGIAEHADVVVMGRVLSTKGPVSIEISSAPAEHSVVMEYMVSEVEVLEVASGSNLTVGDIITVKQGVEDKNAYHLSEGEEAILFLGDHRARTDIAPFVPKNRTQGILSRGNVVRKANLTSVSDVKSTLGAEGLGFDEIWKQVVMFASKDKAAVEAEVAGD